jgi:hypothetical protein
MQVPPSPPPISASANPPSQTSIAVPRGTVVPILVTRDVRVGAFGSSADTHKVKFAVAQPVIVNGYVIAKPGDLVEGYYDTQQNQTKRTFETTTSQEISLNVEDLVNFCGDTIHLGFERTYVGGVRSGSFSFGVHGHDAVFPKGAVLKASTDRFEKSVCAEATTATPPPLPRNVVLPDAQITPSPSPLRLRSGRHGLG